MFNRWTSKVGISKDNGDPLLSSMISTHTLRPKDRRESPLTTACVNTTPDLIQETPIVDNQLPDERKWKKEKKNDLLLRLI